MKSAAEKIIETSREHLKVIDLRSAKQEAERKRCASTVLDAYDRLDHETKRDKAEKRSEVERAARNRL